MIKKISLNELPQYSYWPVRLLGLESYAKKIKTIKEIFREYGNDKWGTLYKKLLDCNHKINIDLSDKIFLGDEKSVFCIGEKIYYGSSIKAHSIFIKMVKNYFDKYITYSDTIVELGAGYGSVIINLVNAYKNKRFIAAELTDEGQNCISLIAEAMKIGDRFLVGKCDYTSKNLINFEIPVNSIIFTSMSILCVPKLPDYFINNIIKLKPKVVLFFETIPQFLSDTLLDLLRKKYIEINDYNFSLNDQIMDNINRGKIEILEINKNFFSENCFLPTSLIVWRPKLGN